MREEEKKQRGEEVCFLTSSPHHLSTHFQKNKKPHPMVRMRCNASQRSTGLDHGSSSPPYGGLDLAPIAIATMVAKASQGQSLRLSG